ncbi:MAG: hypothetical protein QXZ22_08690 [Sulfolobales archaeon]
MDEELIDLLIMGIGAGLKGTIASYINRFVPIGEFAGLVAGAGLYYFGDRIHEKVKVFGKGVLIGAIAQLFAKYVPIGTTTTTTTTTPQTAAYQYAMMG